MLKKNNVVGERDCGLQVYLGGGEISAGIKIAKR